MEKVLIYTEDKYNQLPATLAQRITGTLSRAIQESINKWVESQVLQKLVKRAASKGYDCVIFLVDREIPSSGRPELLQKICTAFKQLCQEGVVGNVRVALVIASPCVEALSLIHI